MRCIVTGRVQGVFFRASTEREAQQLGITGYARNMSDGSVEVLACGEASAVEELKEDSRREASTVATTIDLDKVMRNGFS